MGSYTFKWEHSEANQVFVTGTFDDWGKTHELDKLPSGFFEKSVELPHKEKILYKFVVDNNWITNPHLATKTDSSGNVNNVTYEREIIQGSEIIHPNEAAMPGSKRTLYPHYTISEDLTTRSGLEVTDLRRVLKKRRLH